MMMAARAVANFGSVNHTRIMDLLVSLSMVRAGCRAAIKVAEKV